MVRGLGAARLVSTPSRLEFPSGLGSGLPLQVSPNLGGSASPVSRRALKFSLKSAASAIPPHPRGWSSAATIIAGRENLHVSVWGRWCRSILCSSLAFADLFRLWPRDVDRGGVKVRLDVRRVIFLDHLDADAAVPGDLVDVGPFHQAQADVCVAQAVSRPRPAFTIEPEIFFVQDRLEKLALPIRKEVRGSWKAPFFGTVLVGVLCVPVRGRVLCARRTESGFQSLEGRTAPLILLQ